MNMAATLERPTRVKLNVDDFLLLERAQAFRGFSKAELIDGELLGVPAQGEDEPESDASVAIKLRVQDYLVLDEAGLLADRGKTELIDGVIYTMSPEHRPHWYIKNELTYRIRREFEAFGERLYAGSEGSVLLSQHDLPQPDIVITDDPIGKGPIPVASIRLLIEVADSSRTFDLGAKARLYAAHGVPEYWVADVSGRVIHQMWSPREAGYAERREVAFGERLEAATIDGLVVDTGGI